LQQEIDQESSKETSSETPNLKKLFEFVLLKSQDETSENSDYLHWKHLRVFLSAIQDILLQQEVRCKQVIR
jgi:hypothetical protein